MTDTRRLIIAFVAALMLCMPPTAMAKIILYDDAEDVWSTADWSPAGNTKGNTITVSTEQKRAGAHSYKFMLVPGAGTNVELVLRAVKNATGSSNFIIGQEYWIGYSIYIPRWYNFSAFWTSPQFHLSPDACDPSDLNPNVGFFIETDHSTTISIGGDPAQCSDDDGPHRKIHPAAYRTGQWNDIVLNFKFAYNSTGFFKIWVNDQLTTDAGVNCSNDAKGPYMKMGIYSHPEEAMVVYYDEIKIGDQNSSKEEVSPGGAVPNQAPQVAMNPAGTVTAEVGQPINFGCDATDSDGSIVEYHWTYDTSGVPDSYLQNPGGVSFANAGTFLARVTVKDDDGATASATRTVIITQPEQPPEPIYGLVNDYRFEPGAITTDEEGTTALINNGGIGAEGSATEPDPPGYGAYGAVLNGSGQYFSVGSYNANSPWQSGQHSGTLLVAMKLSGNIGETKYIAGRWDTDTNNRTVGFVIDYPTYQPTINVGYNDGAGNLKLQLGTPLVVGTRYILGFALNAQAKTYHIEAYDADASMWLTPADGSFTEDVNLDGTAAWFIGRRTGGPSPLYFPGTLYWLKTYNTILSVSEMKSVMAGATQAPSSIVYVDTTGGTPYLELETGASDLQLAYTAGSGTGVLTWQGTVAEGMNAEGALTPTANGIVANGAVFNGAGDVVRVWSPTPGKSFKPGDTITLYSESSGSGTLSLSLPAAGTVGSLSYESPIYIDVAQDVIDSICACDCDTRECFQQDVIWRRGERACFKMVLGSGKAYVYSGPYASFAWPFVLGSGGTLDFLYQSGNGEDTWVWYAIIGPDAQEVSNLVMSSVNAFVRDRTGVAASIGDGTGREIDYTAPQAEILPGFSVQVMGLPEALSVPSASGMVVINPAGAGEAVSGE